MSQVSVDLSLSKTEEGQRVSVSHYMYCTSYSGWARALKTDGAVRPAWVWDLGAGRSAAAPLNGFESRRKIMTVFRLNFTSRNARI